MLSSQKQQMSSQITQLVPVLDESNYGTWAKSMKAYLMSLGLWSFANSLDDMPISPDHPKDIKSANYASKTPDEQEALDKLYEIAVDFFNVAHKEWQKKDHQTIGTIILRTNPSIQEELGTLDYANDVWTRLADSYGTATPTSVYKDFKKAIGVRIRTDTHPGPAIDDMFAAFQRLGAAKMSIPKPIQAMMLLATLPQKWEMLISIITQTTEMKDLDLNDV
jgi:hypothetical protein